MKENLTQQIRSAAGKAGADLVGVASRDRFTHLPAESSPLSIFPEMKSLIVIIRRVLRGSMRGIEEGTNFSSTYGSFGYKYLEDNFLSQTTYDTTLSLEASGYEAVPLFAYFPDGMPKGTPVAPTLPAPNVIIDPYFTAYAAGLGEVGLGGFFLTPQYGTRQRFAFILTDAELEADHVQSKSICGDCGECVTACPFGAIDATNTQPFGLPGHKMQVARIDYSICRSCPNGAMLLPGRGSKPDRIAAACGRKCLVKLEASGKLNTRFQNEFRKRSPWVMDIVRRPIESESNGKPSDIGCGKNLDSIGQTAK